MLGRLIRIRIRTANARVRTHARALATASHSFAFDHKFIKSVAKYFNPYGFIAEAKTNQANPFPKRIQLGKNLALERFYSKTPISSTFVDDCFTVKGLEKDPVAKALLDRVQTPYETTAKAVRVSERNGYSAWLVYPTAFVPTHVMVSLRDAVEKDLAMTTFSAGDGSVPFYDFRLRQLKGVCSLYADSVLNTLVTDKHSTTYLEHYVEQAVVRNAPLTVLDTVLNAAMTTEQHRALTGKHLRALSANTDPIIKYFEHDPQSSLMKSKFGNKAVYPKWCELYV